jgi:DNA-binding NarL/FixJ family response regulator
MVTMHDDPDYMLEAIKSGAAGYVLKDASWETSPPPSGAPSRATSRWTRDVAARLLQRLARETAQQSEATQTGPVPAGRLSDLLTPRELEVLQRLTLGRTNSAIAQDLTISVGTAKSHVQRVIQKLGVSDRTQAAVRAVELRLVRTAS